MKNPEAIDTWNSRELTSEVIGRFAGRLAALEAVDLGI